MLTFRISCEKIWYGSGPRYTDKEINALRWVIWMICFLFSDIVLNFRTSFVNKSGQVVYQARLIALNYIRGWFLLDLLAAIPFDFLYIFNINAVS